MMSFLLLLALLPLLILYFQTHKTKNVDPPGPPGLPLIGNLHQFDAKFPHHYLYRLSQHYGSLFSLKLGFRRVVVISSANMLKQIMKSYDFEFSSRPVLVSMQKLSYNGLDVAFSPHTESWRGMRKIATVHLFSTKQLQFFHRIFKDEVAKMVKKISQDASQSKIVNLSETFIAFTSNTICRMAFGKTYGGEEHGKNRFIYLLHETQYVLGGLFVEDFFPLLKWIDYLTGMRAKVENNAKKLDSFYDELINEHLDPNRPKSMEGDILDILLQLNRNNGSSSSSFDVTIENIKGLLMNLITGGTDTTLSGLVWALTALMNNPPIMKRVQTEIRDLAGENKDFIDEEDISKLPYFRAVVKESFRMYPPVPLIPRETMSKKCSVNGYDIEPGTLVYFNAWAIARDPKTWDNPNEFSPERFLGSDMDVRGHDPEVIPFGLGRRGCPGVAIALSELSIALANVLYKFDWELPEGVKVVDFEAAPGLTVHKKNDLLLLPKLVIKPN